MNDALPKIKLSLINKKVLHGEFHEEQDGRIELHNAFFSDCPTFIFNISIRIEDIVFFIEDKETHYTNSIVGKFITDGEYAKGAASKKEEEDYVPQNYEKDGKILVSDSDLGRIEDITIEHHETKACNGHTPLYDQIKENEKRFGVKIDFDESLYTSELDKESEFYKNNIERAKKIEQKILKDKKKVDLDDEERYSAVKTKEGGIRRGSRNKTGSREEEKSALKHGKQVTDKSQNKEPMKIENVSINKDTTETVKMQSDDNKPKNNEKTWKKERSRKGIARKEGEENTSPVLKSKACETATSELHKESVTKTCKPKSPTEIWSNFETESIKSINNTKIPFKVEGKEIISTKRVSYGKPNEGKYKSFDDLFNGIVENFKDNKETKKWAYVDDYRNFKGYAGYFHPYKYK